MLELYNTLTKRKEPFKPIKDKVVLMYDCGPTVYGKPHLGNLARYIMSDILVRYLEYKGYKVKRVMNITDVGHLTKDDLSTSDEGEDKIIAQAKKEGKGPQEIARAYEKEFFKAAKKLNLKIADAYDIEKGTIKNNNRTIIARATEHIPEMIEMIKKLLKKGYAYETSKGIYYNVSKFKNYGKLSGNTLAKLEKGKRIKIDPEKKTPYDFALWIKAPKEHLMQWGSPWGRGYPGWHIECSAMSIKYLGPQIDIHTGGEDNIFPHHEDEIAQSEATTGKSPFVRYWIHRRHMLINNEKMAKSRGNIYTLDDIEKMGYSQNEFKISILSGKYNSKINFSKGSLKQARTTLERVWNLARNKQIENKDVSKDIVNLEKAIEDDLNTPEAIAIVTHTTSKKLLDAADKILGTNFAEPISIDIPDPIKNLASKREKARKDKDFAKADKLRKEIESKGFEIEDTERGYRIRKK